MACNNIGIVLQDQGKLEEALHAYRMATSLERDFSDAFYNMGMVFKEMTFNKPNPSLQRAINELLNKKSYVRPIDISGAAISLLKSDPNFKRQQQLIASEDNAKKLTTIIQNFNKLPLLLTLMGICPLPDIQVEELLTTLRALLLFSVLNQKKSSDLLEVQSALALQCFTNEYVYNQTNEETKVVQKLDLEVKKALMNKEQPSPQAVLALASYKALIDYDWIELLVMTDETRKVFIRQVKEPEKETQLKRQIKTLKEIRNRVSSAVRNQYEENHIRDGLIRDYH